MKIINLSIKNEQGLHARPSTKFAQLCEKFDGEVTVITDKEKVNGKNVMELMLLALGQNDTMTVIVDGKSPKQEQKLLDDLKYLVEEIKFNEK